MAEKVTFKKSTGRYHFPRGFATSRPAHEEAFLVNRDVPDLVQVKVFRDNPLKLKPGLYDFPKGSRGYKFFSDE